MRRQTTQAGAGLACRCRCWPGIATLGRRAHAQSYQPLAATTQNTAALAGPVTLDQPYISSKQVCLLHSAQVLDSDAEMEPAVSCPPFAAHPALRAATKSHLQAAGHTLDPAVRMAAVCPLPALPAFCMQVLQEVHAAHVEINVMLGNCCPRC